jgi:hypothetical protein
VRKSTLILYSFLLTVRGVDEPVDGYGVAGVRGVGYMVPLPSGALSNVDAKVRSTPSPAWPGPVRLHNHEILRTLGLTAVAITSCIKFFLNVPSYLFSAR